MRLLLTKRYAVLRLETLSRDRRVGGKSDSQQRSSVSSNCNSESRPRAIEAVYSLAKDVAQLDEVTALKKKKCILGIASYNENFQSRKKQLKLLIRNA